MTTTTNLKASQKMQESIQKVEKTHGKMKITFGVEMDECNRVGLGFYDYAELWSNILQSKWTVAHDGEISQW